MSLLKKKKRIVVAGLGAFGAELATELARTCEVLGIDGDSNAVDRVKDKVHRALILNVTDFDALSSVVNEEFDEGIVAIGDHLEPSILCTLHLKKIGVKYLRAKAMNADHAGILRALGADQIIQPEQDAARRLARQIVQPNLLDFVPLADEYRVMELRAPASFVGKTLADLNLRSEYDAFVMAVWESGGEEMVFLPGPLYKINAGDNLILIGVGADLNRLSEKE